MGSAILVFFILVCGYNYIDKCTPIKKELEKSQGWNVYLQVALKGSELFLAGFLVAIFINCVLYILMHFLNLPIYIFGAKYEEFSFAKDLNDLYFLSISFFVWLIAICTSLISNCQALNAMKEELSPESQLKVIKQLAEKNAINSLLLESIDSGLPVMITLKSRKVYVGMVDATKFFNIHTNESPVISIIPFISGYRDKDTLRFVPDCFYTLIYSNENIDFNSTPLSYQQFRRLILMDQIESLSLFDAKIFVKFKNNEKSNEISYTSSEHEE